MINLAIENNTIWTFSRRLVSSKNIYSLLNPWLTCEIGRGFFISSNSRRFTHPRPTQKIGYQIGVVGIDKVVVTNVVSQKPNNCQDYVIGAAYRKGNDTSELKVGKSCYPCLKIGAEKHLSTGATLRLTLLNSVRFANAES